MRKQATTSSSKRSERSKRTKLIVLLLIMLFHEGRVFGATVRIPVGKDTYVMYYDGGNYKDPDSYSTNYGAYSYGEMMRTMYQWENDSTTYYDWHIDYLVAPDFSVIPDAVTLNSCQFALTHNGMSGGMS